MGSAPTHPELLDFLAARFVEEGWSFKKMIGFLVTTRAFALGSVASEAAQTKDPANDLLSHARVRRLDAEAIRDSLLAVSGALDPAMFGPPADGADTHRRSIYLPVRRSRLNPFLGAFDAPQPFTALGRRDSTNVPAQSLALLNDPFVIDLAKQWSAALLRWNPDATPELRIRAMFATAFARPPSDDELSKATSYLAALARERGVPEEKIPGNESVWQDFAQSVFNLKEFIYVR